MIQNENKKRTDITANDSTLSAMTVYFLQISLINFPQARWTFISFKDIFESGFCAFRQSAHSDTNESDFRMKIIINYLFWNFTVNIFNLYLSPVPHDSKKLLISMNFDN